MQKKLLIIGKRSGILQWYENILAAAHQSPDYEIQGFALNHNEPYRVCRRLFYLS